MATKDMAQPAARPILRFDVTNYRAKITGGVALEQERVAGGEQRQKHLALEYFACFAVDGKGNLLSREAVESLFRAMSDIDIERGLIRLNAAIQEEQLLRANQIANPAVKG